MPAVLLPPAPHSSYMGATLQYKTFVNSDQTLLRLFAYGNAGGRHIYLSSSHLALHSQYPSDLI